jgi:hypothetical protein
LLAGTNVPDTPTVTTQKALDPPAGTNAPDTPTVTTQKALDPLAVAERHILGPR